jgi:uncharacterized protein YjbI with pentapeptide repeats
VPTGGGDQNPALCARSNGCTGVSFFQDSCLAHVDAADLAAAVEGLVPGQHIDLRGTRITADRLDVIKAALADPSFGGRPRFGMARFDRAVFVGSADFANCYVNGAAGFTGATFEDASFDGAEFRSGAHFDHAWFAGEARFRRVTFGTAASFSGTIFGAACRFLGTTFHGPAVFRSTFDGEAIFGPTDHRAESGTRFLQAATFDHSTFHQGANFGGVPPLGAQAAGAQALAADRDPILGGTRFGRASFVEVTFGGRVAFRGCSFNRSASFAHARFSSAVSFDGAEFDEECSFSGTRFDADAQYRRVNFIGAMTFDAVAFHAWADFSEADLRGGTRLGPGRAHGLDLSKAKVRGALAVQLELDELRATELRVPDGLHLEVDGGIRIDAPDIRSAVPVTVSFVGGELALANVAFHTPATVATSGDRAAPRLIAMTKVDATNLTLVGLDLSGCRFLSCYNRDKLRIEGPPRFAGPPAGRRWTRRLVIAEEHLWRARYDRRPAGWFPQECRGAAESAPPASAGPGAATLAAAAAGAGPAAGPPRAGERARSEAARVQAVYRDLRKGREDAKDEPGAADFYFGEMEMRRAAAAPRSVERGLLTAYWAIAGYGQRASRALAALVLLLSIGAVGFATIGFDASSRIEYRPVATAQPGQPVTYRQESVPGTRPGWVDAAFHSVESATSLLRPTPSRAFTPAGRVLEISLRILGPLLLGLMILAIRGRVKR